MPHHRRRRGRRVGFRAVHRDRPCVCRVGCGVERRGDRRGGRICGQSARISRCVGERTYLGRCNLMVAPRRLRKYWTGGSQLRPVQCEYSNAYPRVHLPMQRVHEQQ